jgi:hypothetical protein
MKTYRPKWLGPFYHLPHDDMPKDDLSWAEAVAIVAILAGVVLLLQMDVDHGVGDYIKAQALVVRHP